jgi:hypothetical protein
MTTREYNTIHQWRLRHCVKTGLCFYCGKKGRTQWSNIDHEYTMLEDDWQEVCVKCHMAYDKEVLGVAQGGLNGYREGSKNYLALIGRLKTYPWFDFKQLA